MVNPMRSWVRLTVRSLPKKSWRDDLNRIKDVAIARMAGTFVVLNVLMAYYLLDATLPSLRHLWGISFLIINLVLYCLVIERIIRVVKYRIRMRDRNDSTRR